MREWTQEQRRAIETSGRPLVLTAAAGSGKTTVLVDRYRRLLMGGLKPMEILAVTFTTDAAEEMRKRLLAGLEDSALRDGIERTPYLGTLHSFCYGLIHQYGSLIGLPPVEGIATPFDCAETFEGAFRAWRSELDERTFRELLRFWLPGDLKEVLRQLAFAQSAFRASLRHPPQGIEADVRKALESTAPLFARIERSLKERGLYTFDELETLTLRLFTESDEPVKRLQQQFRAVLVDEFQDTSAIQWAILEKLLHGSYDRLFVVGDPKQSIYSFRNAEVRLFFETGKRLLAEGGEALELTMNFRSQPRLIDQVNAVSDRLFGAAGGGFAPMRAGRPDTAESACLTLRRFPAGENTAETALREAQAVADAIAGKVRDGARPGDFALLFRVSDRIGIFAAALAEKGIARTAKRTGRLYSTYEALDLGAYLRALENPFDDFRLAAFAVGPYGRLTTAELWEAQKRDGETLYEKLVASASVRDRLGWFFSLVESGEFDAEEALATLLEKSGSVPSRIEVLREWITPLCGKSFTVSDAVERLEIWEREDVLFQSEMGGGERDAVQLMTVHGAKGLEFPHVHLVDCLRRTSARSPALRLHPEYAPGFRIRGEEGSEGTASYEVLHQRQGRLDAEESNRILYVALTRAKETLTIWLPEKPAKIASGTWGSLLEETLG